MLGFTRLLLLTLVLNINSLLQSKPNVTHFLHCTREIASAHPENLPALVKHTIFNELSNARSTSNMAVLGVLFSADSERAAASLASVFVELLLQKVRK